MSREAAPLGRSEGLAPDQLHHSPGRDRSSITRWRQRLGEEMLTALLQESLSVATRAGATLPADFTKVIVDTTVQEK